MSTVVSVGQEKAGAERRTGALDDVMESVVTFSKPFFVHFISVITPSFNNKNGIPYDTLSTNQMTDLCIKLVLDWRKHYPMSTMIHRLTQSIHQSEKDSSNSPRIHKYGLQHR